MKTISTFLFFLLFTICIKAQTYNGTITPSSPAPNSTITISFSLASGSNSANNLVIYIYNSYLQTYTALATTSTFNGLAYYAYYVVPANTPNYTVLQFAIGTNSTPVTFYGVISSVTVLPVIFKSFTAVLQGTDKTVLQWELASNSDQMGKSIIYRSADGINFNIIDTVKGSSNQYVYNYTDYLKPADNTVFYKVACLGLDGYKTISNTVCINKSNPVLSSIKILNNTRINNQLFLSGIDLNNYKAGEINIYDAMGRKCPCYIINSNTINIYNSITGIYYLKIKDNPPVSFIVQQ